MLTVNPVDRSVWLRFLPLISGTLLALYGGLGLLFNLHFFQRIAQAIDLYKHAGQWTGPDAPYLWNPPAWFLALFEPLSSHYDRAVLWVWPAWGMGLVFLLLAAGRRPGFPRLRRRPFSGRDALALVLLAVVLFLGYGLRARFLLPLADGTMPVSHYDEMVYLEATLLWQQGLQPYVDFFLAHPPGILYAFRPAVALGDAWGGPALLVAGRWSQCLMGLLTVGLFYLVAREVGGRRAGLLAALVLALDVEVVQVAPLETVVNLAAVVALGLYLAALKVAGRGGRFFLLVLAGGVAALGALTKAPGVVTLVLLGLLALLAGQWRDLLAGAVGAAATVFSLAGPLALRAPLAFFRQVVAFQLLRPQETFYGRNHLARMTDYPGSRLTFLLLIAAVLLLTGNALADAWGRMLRRGRRPDDDAGHSSGPSLRPILRESAGPVGWGLPLILTIVPLLFLFSYGRAYHSRYYVQLVPWLALLVAAGFGAEFRRFYRLKGGRGQRWLRGGRILVQVLGLGLLLLAGPHLVHQRMVGDMVRYDGTYGPIGEALQAMVSDDGAVLALDPGYPLVAGRPPARLPDGTYLLDGAGLMVYRALGLAGMSPRQILDASAQTSREINPKIVFHRPAAQDLVVSALRGAEAAVIDPRIAADNLTPQTQEFLSTRGEQILWEQYTAAFAVERVNLLGQSAAGLALWDLNLRPLSAEGEGPAVVPGEPLVLPTGGVLQISLYWYVEHTPASPLKVSLELRDAAGQVVARLYEFPHFGEPPTQLWQEDWVYQDHHNLALSPDLPPGEYSLHVTLLEADSGQSWPWVGEDLPGGTLFVGVVRLER